MRLRPSLTERHFRLAARALARAAAPLALLAAQAAAAAPLAQPAAPPLAALAAPPAKAARFDAPSGRQAIAPSRQAIVVGALVAGLQRELASNQPQSAEPDALGSWLRGAIGRQNIPSTSYSMKETAAPAPLPGSVYLRLPAPMGATSNDSALKARLDFASGQWTLHLWGARDSERQTLAEIANASPAWSLAGPPALSGGPAASLDLPLANATPGAIARLGLPPSSAAPSLAPQQGGKIDGPAAALPGAAPAPAPARAPQAGGQAAAPAAWWAPVASVADALRQGLARQEPYSLSPSDIGAWEKKALFSADRAALSMSTAAPSKFFLDWPQGARLGLSARMELVGGMWTLRLWASADRPAPDLDALAQAAQGWKLPGAPKRAIEPMSVLSLPLALAKPETAARYAAQAAPGGQAPAGGLAQASFSPGAPMGAPAARASLSAPSPSASGSAGPSAQADLEWQPQASAEPLPAFSGAARPESAAALGPFLWASSIASMGFSPFDSEAQLSRRWRDSLAAVGLAGSPDAAFQSPSPDRAALRFAAFPDAVFRLRRIPGKGWGAQIEAKRQDCGPLLLAIASLSGSQALDGANPKYPATCSSAVSLAFVPFSSGKGITLAGASPSQGAAQRAASASSENPAPPQAKAQPLALAAQASSAKSASALGALAQMSSMSPSAGLTKPAAPASAPASASALAALAQAAAAQAPAKAFDAPARPVAEAPAAPVAAAPEKPVLVAAAKAPEALKLPQGVASFARVSGPAPAPLYWPGQQAAAFPRDLYDDRCASDSDADQATRAEHARKRLAWMRQSPGAATGSLFP